MNKSTSNLYINNNYPRKFGAFFTPPKWANKLVERYCFKEWLGGATVLDPTAGEGVFIKAFLNIAKKQGIELTKERIGRLYGIELNPNYVNSFYKSVAKEYNIEFPKTNFIQGDIFFLEKEIKTDILIGNPPWVNFADLDENYKEKIKHFFIDFGLVRNKIDLLLGNSRIDLATLVITKILYSNLKENGKAIFFLPLSIFQNDGANQAFRNYNIRGVNFAVKDILDFNREKIFENVLGRYGIAYFKRNREQKFPINYHILKNGKWEAYRAKPLFNITDPLTVFENKEIEKRLNNFQKILLPKHCKPRQGINTCGANDIFFFNSYKILDKQRVRLTNKLGDDITINKKYVFPLAVLPTLTTKNPKPQTLVIIPHFENGKPIDLATLKQGIELYRYFSKYRTILQNRKGVLINTWIKKGFWWALLGVGKYNFAPYKIIWKAFGESVFTPVILPPDNYFGSWQGNQSLHVYIGVSNRQLANQIFKKLANPLIQEYLSSLRMQGTCNWAQPGRIKKIIEFV